MGLLQLLPIARSAFFICGFQNQLAIFGHNKAAFTYVLEAAALPTFHTSNSRVFIVRIFHCAIIFCKFISTA